jgi:hypothetical protein
MGRPAKKETGICEVCGTPFPIDHSNRGQKRCGLKCGMIAYWARRKGMTVEAYLAQRKAEKLSPSKKARKEAMRPIPNPQAGPRVCLSCNRTFPSTGPGNRICERCAASEEATPCRIHTAHIREG